MSSLTDSASIFRYHRDMLTAHGAQSSYALGWRDQESQLIRFKALAEVADLDGQTVLDAGCGYADLYIYLQLRYPKLRYYCGVEQIPELLDEAVKRYSHYSDAGFISGNFITRRLPVMDYVLASGSLNYASTDPSFIFKAIDKLYNSCGKGLAFNLLCKVPSDGLLVAYNPDLISDYCNTLSTKVILKTGYADDDFTVFMCRN